MFEESNKARNNFIHSQLPQYTHFYTALCQVKLAAARANLSLGYLPLDIGHALCEILVKMCEGVGREYFNLDPLQGGAGTSTNMNINEIACFLANRELKVLVDPLEHVNLHQSTNDVYPTAVKIAALYFLKEAENAANTLLQTLQTKEKEFNHIIKIGRTQLQRAVPITLGQEFGAYSEAIARDRWRLFKCQERIRVINLGGTAIGTGVNAPRKYIYRVNEELRLLTGLPLSRAENLVDATQNHDQLAEVFAMIKVMSLNLEKISNDLRLLASFGEIDLPKVALGSTIMPGKVNPVILEMVIQVARKIQGNEAVASSCIAHGELELNAFLPLISHLLFESLDILTQAIDKFDHRCLKDLVACPGKCRENLLTTPASCALLIPLIGYHKASEVADLMHSSNLNIVDAALQTKYVSSIQIDKILHHEHIGALGHD